MIIPYNATLDLKGNNSKIEPIRATVGDSKSIQLNINVVIDTTPADLTGHTAKITFTKSDDTTVFDNLIIDDAINGKMHVVISNQAFAAVGQVNAEIEIFDATDGRLSSNAFAFTARKGELNDGTIISSSQFTALDLALVEVTDFANYRTELTNARQGFTDLQSNLVNKDARLDHLGFDFEQQGGVPNDITKAESNRVLMQSLQDTINTMGRGNIRVSGKTFYMGQNGTNEYSIIGRSGVSVIGAGVGETIFKIKGTNPYSLFWYKPADLIAGDYIENFTYRDFSVDGYEMTITPYSHKGKAFYFQKVRNGIFMNLELLGTPSTALGTDFLHNVHIHNIHCVECGRQWEEAWTNGDTRPAELGPGGAGIGIGTGLLDDESFTISDCVTEQCGHYGIFLEHQALFDPATFTKEAKGVVIANCVTRDGRFAGIGVRGGHNISIIGVQSFGNKHGMYFDAKAGHAELVNWKNITIGHCTFSDNTSMGGYVGGNVTSETFKIDTCTFSDNGAEGLVLGRDGDNHTQKGVSVVNCDMKNNALEGLYIDAGTYFRTLKVMGNTLSYNGGNGFKDSNAQISGGRYINNYFINNTGSGMALFGTKTHLEIKGNYARDDQATKTQQYGLSMSGGALNYSTIEGNDFRRNGTKGMSIADSVIASTSYVRGNKTDENGMLDMPVNSYVSFPSELANFLGATSLSIHVQFRLIAGITGGIEVFHMIVSHTEDDVSSNPKGWDLHVRNTGLLVFEARQATGGTILQRISTTALALNTTYDVIITMNGTTTTMSINGVNETFSSSTGTDADLLTAMQNNNTTFPVYLKGLYYNGTLKNGGAARVGIFNVSKTISGATSNTIYGFDNYGVSRDVYDISSSSPGLHGTSTFAPVQIDNFL
ncbi:BppU family phage baseplate upper protein [Clostridium pasteurianum]|uniref:Right handed beta helix domain-containing protein n=1 Tax=Clostridium pasteurianum BC1 TaxID=86416 RepID=R4K8F5_CLOPA|nr:BppU family phage baseplate upper protein [Clostridium pasteurianum]AGK96814.1 protein of unknown function (DUF2479) [Clostridium pasteurianum BC1]